MVRTLKGHTNLYQGSVGTAHSPNPAAAPGSGGDPLNGIMAIGPFLGVGYVEVLARALGSVAATHVLEGHDVAARGEKLGNFDVAAVVLVVGGAAEKGQGRCCTAVSSSSRCVRVTLSSVEQDSTTSSLAEESAYSRWSASHVESNHVRHAVLVVRARARSRPGK